MGGVYLRGVICVAEKCGGAWEQDIGGVRQVNCLKTYKAGFGCSELEEKRKENRL